MTALCTICGDAVDENSPALCNGCDEPFHLAVSQGSGEKECGRVWVNEQFMTLEYGCLRCLGELPAASSTNGAAADQKQAGRRRYRKVR